MEIKPSSVLFSAAIIDNLFHKNSHHSYCRIGETLDLLCEGKIKISDIPQITVVKQGTGWVTANNRRLWVFRQMERLGKCRTILVYAVTVEGSPVSNETGFANVTVRENPGGLWYLLPSCEMKDPFSNVIWDTVKHIKENMFPPPNRRTIITIFQNLSQAKPSRGGKAGSRGRSLSESMKDENSSQPSSGYLIVRCGEFNITQIDIIEKNRRIGQWVLDQTVSSLNHNMKDYVFKLLSQTMVIPKYPHSVPGVFRRNSRDEFDTFSEISVVSNKGSLQADIQDPDDIISAPSCDTSGYLIVTGELGNVDVALNANENSNIQSGPEKITTIDEDQNSGLDTQSNKRLPISDLSCGMLVKPDVVAKAMTNEIGNLLSEGKKDFAEQIPKIRSYIQTVIEDTFAQYDRKHKANEFEINALKDDMDNILATKNEETKRLTKRLEEAERNNQDILKSMEIPCKALPDQKVGINVPSVDNHESEKGAACGCDLSLPCRETVFLNDEKETDNVIDVLAENVDILESIENYFASVSRDNVFGIIKTRPDSQPRADRNACVNRCK